jgi:hypothetical protein
MRENSPLCTHPSMSVDSVATFISPFVTLDTIASAVGIPTIALASGWRYGRFNDSEIFSRASEWIRSASDMLPDRPGSMVGAVDGFVVALA